MVAVAGVIVTEATGTGVTVIVEGPLLPSLVAVIVAVPAALPVTSPLAVTVATAVLLLPQLTVRPDNGLPLASFGVAVSCTVWPTCTDAVLGLTVTDATGTVLTVIAAVPLCPSLVAVIVAAPAVRSEEHTSELQSHSDLVCRLLTEKKKTSTHETFSICNRAPWSCLAT